MGEGGGAVLAIGREQAADLTHGAVHEDRGLGGGQVAGEHTVEDE